MSIALPALPWQAGVKPRLIRYGSDLTPALGGPMARINRLGSRYAIAVTLPTLDRDMGPVWIGARLAAEAQNSTLTLAWPSALFENAPAALVNGAGQAGTLLNVKGLPASAAIPALTPLSFQAGGRNYLHLTTAALVTGADGTISFPIAPMLRAAPADSTAVNFATPTIEGFVDGTTVDWELQLSRFHKISFTLTENA